jgi:DOPA 4,5-dioxygenase
MFRSILEVGSYHAHIYFDPVSERDVALELRQGIADRFSVRLGTMWDRPVGPHSRAMYQVAFAPDLFPALVPWLMLNHAGLSILIHPNTANARRDHLDDPIWIGEALALDGEVLPEEQEVELAGPANTSPTMAP